MKKLLALIVGVICLTVVSSCENEVEAVVSVDHAEIYFSKTSIYILPVYAENDNCSSRTVVYYIDGEEIGRTSKSPYDITHQFTEGELTVGTHTIKMVFSGQNSSGGVSASVSYTMIVKYAVLEDGNISTDVD